VLGTDDAAFRASFVSQNVSVPEGNSIGGLLVFTLLGAVAELKKRRQKV
jgi:formate/nitrite transporter FocA (FNT family)